MQLEELPAVIGSPSSNTFVQWMRFNTYGQIACMVHLPDKGAAAMKGKGMLESFMTPT
jgi:hypothetical protein